MGIEIFLLCGAVFLSGCISVSSGERTVQEETGSKDHWPATPGSQSRLRQGMHLRTRIQSAARQAARQVKN